MFRNISYEPSSSLELPRLLLFSALDLPSSLVDSKAKTGQNTHSGLISSFFTFPHPRPPSLLLPSFHSTFSYSQYKNQRQTLKREHLFFAFYIFSIFFIFSFFFTAASYHHYNWNNTRLIVVGHPPPVDNLYPSPIVHFTHLPTLPHFLSHFSHNANTFFFSSLN